MRRCVAAGLGKLCSDCEGSDDGPLDDIAVDESPPESALSAHIVALHLLNQHERDVRGSKLFPPERGTGKAGKSGKNSGPGKTGSFLGNSGYTPGKSFQPSNSPSTSSNHLFPPQSGRLFPSPERPSRTSLTSRPSLTSLSGPSSRLPPRLPRGPVPRSLSDRRHTITALAAGGHLMELQATGRNTRRFSTYSAVDTVNGIARNGYGRRKSSLHVLLVSTGIYPTLMKRQSVEFKSYIQRYVVNPL